MKDSSKKLKNFKKLHNSSEKGVYRTYWRDKEQRIKETVKSVKNDLTFTTVTKEIEYMGLKERKRVYVYGNYWTAKLWGSLKSLKAIKNYTL